MARIIKFRGRSIADDTWVYGDLMQTTDNQAAIWPIESNVYTGMVTVYPETVGQYTNIRDRKGNEIYEGDIVRQDWEAAISDDYGDAFTSTGTQTGIVVIRTKGVCISPCYCVNSHSEDSFIVRDKRISGYRCEIIGNKHDDPKLFESICNV